MVNIAVFVSGNGTNCENIIRYFSGNTRARVVLVVSNRKDAYALVRARNLGVPTVTLSKADLADESKVISLLYTYDISFIALAGFLLIVPDYLIRHYEGKMVNIHPSLLPKYGGKGMYGKHVHEAVKAGKETETGITIHYVNEKYDDGKIIFQAKTDIVPEDSPEDIAAKVHRLEIANYPRVIESLISKE